HRGRIVAEGTPSALKADVGRSTVEAIPAEEDERARVAEILLRFGDPTQASPKGVAVQLANSNGSLADVVRALDEAKLAIANIQLHAPTLDDVFLAKTGTSLEGAAEDDEQDSDAE
ncbi:MAG TPA: DUF4162 domain-containing protein, partial [Gaiellaceae bacterium]